LQPEEKFDFPDTNSYNTNMKHGSKSVVSERGQITIPKRIRDRLGLRQGLEIEFEARDGLLIGRKVTQEDPVAGVTGIIARRDVDSELAKSRGPIWREELDADSR
jgi:antitoxin PrlF